MPDKAPHDPDRPSKSERKREHQRLQSLVAAMVELKPKARASLPTSDEFAEELAHCAQMGPSGARQRLMRHLAQLLEHENVEALRNAVEQMHLPNQQQAENLHQLEAMREKLLMESESAISELTASFPAMDLKQLRALTTEAKKEREAGAPRGAGRKLFRFLRANSGSSSE